MIISDNSPQFASAEFRKFAANWNFRHVTSSPYYPQANGEAERERVRAVKTAKDILKQGDLFLAPLINHSTPIPALGASPAELMFGQKLQTTLPTIPSTLRPGFVNHDTVREHDGATKHQQKKYFNRRAHPLPELHPGDPVLVK